MKKTFYRAFACLLAVVLTVGIAPTSVYAAADTQTGSAKAVAWQEDADKESMMAPLLRESATLEKTDGITYAVLTFVDAVLTIPGGVMPPQKVSAADLKDIRSIHVIDVDTTKEYPAEDIVKGGGIYKLKLQLVGENTTVKLVWSTPARDTTYTIRLHLEEENWTTPSNLADGAYNLSVNLLKNRTDKSMMDSAIAHTANLTVKDGLYYLTLDLKSLSVGNISGYLKTLSYYDPATVDAAGKPTGTVKAADVVSTQKYTNNSDVIDEFNKAESWRYPKLVRFPLIDKAAGADGLVPLQVFIPIMGAAGTQNVLAKLDWSSLKIGEVAEVARPLTDTTDLSAAKITAIADKVYTGKAIAPALTVKLNLKTLVKGSDYTVSYSNNVNVGKATVTIKGTGEYAGTVTGSFKILPKKTTVSKLKAGKKQLKISWKKVSTAQKITKYLVSYKVKGSSKWTNKTLSAKSNSLTLKKLKKGKVYQVKLRSYRAVAGAKYYSAWSAVKTAPKIK